MGTTAPLIDQNTFSVILLILNILIGIITAMTKFSLAQIVKQVDKSTENNTELKDETALKLQELSKEFSTEIKELNKFLTTHFVSKEEWVYTRDRYHTLSNTVQDLLTKETLRERREYGMRSGDGAHSRS